jgi:hypothetical protein
VVEQFWLAEGRKSAKLLWLYTRTCGNDHYDQQGRGAVDSTLPFDWTVKDIVKNAGFQWSPTEKLWWTRDETIAARLDPQAAYQVNAAIQMARVRHATAVAKILHVIEHLKECLEAEEKVVVFAPP